MRNEGVQPVGFRPIDRSDYLACCALKHHPCWQALNAADNADNKPAQEGPLGSAKAAAVHHNSRLKQQVVRSADELHETSSGDSMLNQRLADAVRGADYHEDETGFSFGEQAPADVGMVKSLIDAGADIKKCK